VTDQLWIHDAADPRLADYRALTDVALRVRHEGERGVFVAEGPNVVRALLTSPHPVRSLLLTPRQAEDLEPDLAAAAVSAPLYLAEQPVVEQVVGFHLHRGALAVGERLPDPGVAAVASGARLLVVCQRLNDHENLGALFRNARALGADGVLLDPETADPYYRRAVRVSLGHLLHVPWARLPALPDGLAALAGFTTVALTPGGMTPLSALAADPPERVALLVGPEGPGLDEATLAAADVQVRIPMRPGVDSVNVATAAALALHALARPVEGGAAG
jgi:tRNA G18 (ribose-2'-O)-methylase SpoU